VAVLLVFWYRTVIQVEVGSTFIMYVFVLKVSGTRQVNDKWCGSYPCLYIVMSNVCLKHWLKEANAPYNARHLNYSDVNFKATSVTQEENFQNVNSDEWSGKLVVFWVVAPCRLAWVCWLFRDPYCFHHQGDESSSWWWRCLHLRKQTSYSRPWEP
jgi:hypothetical protein